MTTINHKFLSLLDSGTIPDFHPDTSFHTMFRDLEHSRIYWKDEFNKRGMWAIVDKIWTKQLADFIGKRSVLEIMAGKGFLAHALSDFDIDIIATDDISWTRMHSEFPYHFDVQKYGAIEAIKMFHDRDILICSWPPHKDSTLFKCLEFWNKPIIYIGESQHGCNAENNFFDNVNMRCLNFSYPQWDSIHDDVYFCKRRIK